MSESDDGDGRPSLASMAATVSPSPRLRCPRPSVSLQDNALRARQNNIKSRVSSPNLGKTEAGGWEHPPATQSVDFNSKYLKKAQLGKGASGVVYAVQQRQTGSGKPSDYACKEVPLTAAAIKAIRDRADDATDDADADDISRILKELHILKSLHHPNLIELIDYFIEDGVCRLVMPLLSGGELRESLAERGSLAEDDARGVITGVLRGVAHLHSKGIAHRDLKLENIIFSDAFSTYEDVKIIDLGLAKKLCDGASMSGHTACGSPLYVAPEVAVLAYQDSGKNMARYGLAADLWSCGVILYMLLSGHPPFDTRSGVYKLLQQIRRGAYTFADPVWELMTEEAKDMVRQLLTLDASARPTALEALQHPWMQG